MRNAKLDEVRRDLLRAQFPSTHIPGHCVSCRTKADRHGVQGAVRPDRPSVAEPRTDASMKERWLPYTETT